MIRPGAWERLLVPVLSVVAIGFASACAAGAPPSRETPAGSTAGASGDSAAVSAAVSAADSGTVSAPATTIPPERLPPPGQCRIWSPAETEDERAAREVGRCSVLRDSIPAGAWLIYRPTDDADHVRVWQYGDGREVRAQRIHDARTGELIRHVGPTGD